MTITRATRLPTTIPVSTQPLSFVPSGGVETGPAKRGHSTRDTFDAAPVRVAQGDDKKKTKRDKLIDHITRGNDPAIDGKLRQRIEYALSALSDKELKRLDDTGFRIFVGREAPPDLIEAGLATRKLTSPAQYSPGVKVILLNPDRMPSGSQIMHEVGHAKDDMLDDPKKLKALTKYKDEATRIAMLEKSSTMASDTNPKIKKAYDAYNKRFGSFPKDEHFHTPTQSDSYARSDPNEFYAEAFATFHGGTEEMKARLLDQAPEIYAILEKDAKAQGLKVPDRAALKGKTNYTGLPNE